MSEIVDSLWEARNQNHKMKDEIKYSELSAGQVF